MTHVKTEEKSGIPLLLVPPLAEVIFELRWELQQSDVQKGFYRDAAYPMMYGRMYERMQKDFPIIEDLPAVQAHPDTTPYVVRHRMRKEKNGWPLVQVGPGILTINDAKGYSWRAFRTLALRAIELISDLYPTGGAPLNFLKAEMRYVNAINVDLQKDSPLSFLEEKLHTKIDLSSALFTESPIDPRPVSVGLNLAFPLNKPLGNFGCSFNLGQSEGKSAYIFQSVVFSLGEVVPQDKEGFETWLIDAHAVAQSSFTSFCKGSLMKKFCATV